MQRPNLRYVLIGAGFVLAALLFVLLHESPEDEAQRIGLLCVPPSLPEQPTALAAGYATPSIPVGLPRRWHSPA